MKKILLINETVIHTHAVEIEVKDEEEFKQFLNDLDCEHFEDKDDVLNAIKEMDNIKTIGVEDDYSFDVDSIEFDTKEDE